MPELRKLLRRQTRLSAGNGIAFVRVADRIAKKIDERQAGAMGARRFERQHPASDRAGDCECSKRPARRNALVLAVELQRRPRTGTAHGDERAHAAGRLADEPDTVAADMVHMRIDHRNGRCHCDHGLDGVAALGKRHAPGFDGRLVRGADDPLAMPAGVQIH